MRRLLALCIGSLACTLALAAPIEIMVEDAAAPMSNPDGSGYANEIVLAAFAAMDTPVKLTVVPYARCKKYVLSGAVAACLSMSDAPELAGKVRLSGLPLFYAYPRFYYHASHPLAVKSLTDLKPGLRIGIVNGYEYPAEILRLTERGIHLLEARSEETNLKKLAVGHIDMVVSMMDDFKSDDALIARAGVQQVALLITVTHSDSAWRFPSDQGRHVTPIVKAFGQSSIRSHNDCTTQPHRCFIALTPPHAQSYRGGCPGEGEGQAEPGAAGGAAARTRRPAR